MNSASRPERRLVCLLLGHDDVPRRESLRLALCCQRCGRTTSGWSMGHEAAPVSSRSGGPDGRLPHCRRHGNDREFAPHLGRLVAR